MTKIPDLPNSTYEDTLVHAIHEGKKENYVHEFTLTENPSVSE